MLRKNIFVRCPVEDEEFPRYFGIGKISEINEEAERAAVIFYDVDGIGAYYELPKDQSYSFKQLVHAWIPNGVTVKYNNESAIVQASVLNKDDEYYYYYILTPQDEIIFVRETDIIAGYNNGGISPLEQLKTYEFQKPVWYIGRSTVSRTMQIIENSLYGFKELAGCKIFLKAHQLKTVLRCLKDPFCRFMIADEVGLGKTVEASAVLKLFLKDRHDQKILLVVPNTLIEQWKTELAFKFELFEGENENKNYIRIISTDFVSLVNESYDFIIVDEVHRFLKDEKVYQALLMLSIQAKNIIMLSATPVQNRKEEYKKLLTLIQPKKYQNIDQNSFNDLLNLQNVVIRKIHDALNSLEDYCQEIEDSNNQHTEDIEDIFDDILSTLKKISALINNNVFQSMLEEINYDADDFGIPAIRTAIAYVCENYQLEKSIIRNRRIEVDEDEANERQKIDLSYNLQTENNNLEFNTYRELCDWLEEVKFTPQLFTNKFGRLIGAFFSSAHAFYAELKASAIDNVPERLIHNAEKWCCQEEKLGKNIKECWNDIDTFASRAVSLLDYIDQECFEKKVLIFTHYKETFNFYSGLLCECFGSENCCFFCDGMDQDELELNAYRFQNDNEKYRILLSDETGGEGRNFQNADCVIHIDIPWDVNMLEQRIGRLDRIGREKGKPVISVVAYAKDTIEEDLFRLWAEGLGIFTKAQSGLEIIMNDINEEIIGTICDDFKYGLSSIIPKMIKLIEKQTEIVNKERYFDIAALQYGRINQLLERSIELLNKNETDYFASAMMSWASLSGFRAKSATKAYVVFSKSSLSYMSAKNTLFVPPDMKVVIDARLNQMRNRIRALNGELTEKNDIETIRGTFNREIAVLNDYLHFYAPGDKIFESIINNAVHLYKGTCSAFEFPAAINWQGLIFVWNVKLNDALIYQRHLNRYLVNQYRGFLPSEQIITVVSVSQTEITDQEVIREYKKMFLLPAKSIRYFKNFGERHGNKAYIYNFQKKYPAAQWRKGIDNAYQRAHQKAKKALELVMKAQLGILKQELTNQMSAQQAASIYYGRKPEEGFTELIEQNKEIYRIVSSYELILDSVCFVKMSKYNER